MPKSTPINEVLRMRKSGMNDQQIIRQLDQTGYSQREIADAMNQSGIKQGVSAIQGNDTLRPSLLDEDIPVPEPPQGSMSMDIGMPSQSYMPDQGFSPIAYPTQEVAPTPEVQELVESVVEEKWNQFSDVLANLEIWKSRMNDDMAAVKQELLRLNRRFDLLQNTMAGRVDEYSHNVQDMGTELKALEKVFKNILEPLTMNIKELNRITEDMKEASPRRKRDLLDS